MNGVETVQGIRRASVIHAQPLVTKSGGYSVGPEQGSQKVALRVAVAGPGGQDLRRGAGHRVAAIVSTVLDGIADPCKATSGNYFWESRPCGECPGLRRNGRMGPVDHLADA